MIKFSLNFGHKLTDLEAKLQGVNGFTGRGEIEYTVWKNGVKVMEVELRGVAGRSADVMIDGARINTVSLDKGAADETFDTSNGVAVPTLQPGAKVEIWQNGQAILEGVLKSD